MADYHIEIKTDKYLGRRVFVHRLLDAWCKTLSPSLTPEFFDLGEPIRHSFDDYGIDSAVEMWLSNGMGLMLRRRSKPKFIAEIDWFEREKGLDPRLFPWSCSVSLHRDAGDDLAQKLLTFMIDQFEAAYGYVTDDDDLRRKHFVTFEDSTGTTEMYEGLDIEEDEVLPGIYWTTYFGPWAVGKIGKGRFRDLEAEKIVRINSGFLVTAYRSSSEIGSAKAAEIEEEMKGKLGSEHFFDKSLVDVESLKDTPEEAEEIEKLIEEVKAKKRSNK